MEEARCGIGTGIGDEFVSAAAGRRFQEVTVHGGDDRAERKEKLQRAVNPPTGLSEVDERLIQPVGCDGKPQRVQAQPGGLPQLFPQGLLLRGGVNGLESAFRFFQCLD
jgi:hypothetical protein